MAVQASELFDQHARVDDNDDFVGLVAYIVAFGLLLGAGVLTRVQPGHSLRAPGSQPAQGAVSGGPDPQDL